MGSDQCKLVSVILPGGSGVTAAHYWPGLDPETGYVDADWPEPNPNTLADGAGHTFCVPEAGIGGSEMGKPLSMDLRRRALAAVDAGMSRRAAAGRLGVSVSSVIRWDAQRCATGSFAPKPQGGDMRSRRIEARHADVMAAFEEERDQSLEELRTRLTERGVAASTLVSEDVVEIQRRSAV